MDSSSKRREEDSIPFSISVAGFRLPGAVVYFLIGAIGINGASGIFQLSTGYRPGKHTQEERVEDNIAREREDSKLWEAIRQIRGSASREISESYARFRRIEKAVEDQAARLQSMNFGSLTERVSTNAKLAQENRADIRDIRNQVSRCEGSCDR